MNYRFPYVVSYSIHRSTCIIIDYISSCIRAGGIFRRDDLLVVQRTCLAAFRGLKDSYRGRWSAGVSDLKEMEYRNYDGNSEITAAKLHRLVGRATEN